MAEIYINMLRSLLAKSSRSFPGFALIAAVLITSLLLLAGTYFVGTSLTDIYIARSQGTTTVAYYLAEAATALMIQQLRTDTTLSGEFVQGTLTQTNSTLTRASVITPGDSIQSYTISTAPGEATVYSRATTPLETTTVVRRTQSRITRALGSAVTDYALLTGGNGQDLYLKMDATFQGGIVFGNDDVELSNNAQITVQGGQVWAHDEIKTPTGTRLKLTNAAKTQTGVASLPMPAIDFDSSHPTSWRSQATQIMTPPEFNALPNNTTLSGIIFVEGTPAHMNKNLTINGLLVVNGRFDVEHPGHITILAPASGAPAGLLANGKLEIENSSTIQGLVYSNDSLEIEYDETDAPLNVSITGGLIGRQVTISRDSAGVANIVVTHDASLIGRVLNAQFNTTSPMIDIGHWEEDY